MIALTLNPYCEILKKFPRLGLISFGNFDSKKSPCNPIGFDEVFCQQGKTGFSILRFLDEEDGADVLFRGAFPTHNYFLANHFNKPFRKHGTEFCVFDAFFGVFQVYS